MNHLLEQTNQQANITCDSAGTGSWHVGDPPDRRMAAAAEKRGITLRGRARQFQPSDFQSFDLILAMDRSNYRDILALDPEGEYQEKVKLMCDFCTQHDLKDVPDPYYGGPEGFDRVLDLLLDACEGLLNAIEDEVAAQT